MKAEISTEDYEFFLDNENVFVKFLNQPTSKLVNLRVLNIKIIGLTKSLENDNKSWMVCIITQESIQKLQIQVSKSLEIVGFYFNDQRTALTVQNFLITYLIGEK
jgi:hypothetical protein